ncbi:hypothetical protein Ahy_A08g037500 [Arachis hypogaea]|uniref:Uncharacterized protein n=1 Tax=Arachis hypogaea TaxID=3818 RepID=A0A445BQZ6_ARAHY|nr:hypothetical protein Ahy_A08g037500 [Arachis hypogaea]
MISKKTMAEGRRIGLSKACENPTCAEIGDCCNYLKLPFAIEVMFIGDYGVERKQLMLRVADMVPKHHGRTKKQEAAVSTSNAGASNKSGKEVHVG